MTRSLLEQVHWIIECHVTLFVCCFGIVGNTISIFVWQRLKKKMSPTNFSIVKFFTLLAFIDILVLVFTLWVDFLPTVYPNIKTYYAFMFTFIYIGHPAHFFFLFVSIFLTAAISLDRLKLIFYPLIGMKYGNKITSCFIMTVFALATVLNIPSFLEYRILITSNQTQLIKVDYETHQRFGYIVFFSHCAGGVFLPLLTICVANILILVKTYKRKVKNISINKASTSRISDEHSRMTLILVAVTGMCWVMLGFQCFSRCVLMFVSNTSLNLKIVDSVARFGNLAIPLNSALNILMFCLPGKSFRSELVKMLKRR